LRPPTGPNRNRKHIYGLATYDYLRKYVKSAFDGEQVDPKALHVLWEHKKLMVLRLKYLYDINYLLSVDYFVEKYENIEKQALVARNLLIKYNLTKDTKIIQSIVAILDTVEEKEKILVNELIVELSNRISL